MPSSKEKVKRNGGRSLRRTPGFLPDSRCVPSMREARGSDSTMPGQSPSRDSRRQSLKAGPGSKPNRIHVTLHGLCDHQTSITFSLREIPTPTKKLENKLCGQSMSPTIPVSIHREIELFSRVQPKAFRQIQTWNALILTEFIYQSSRQIEILLFQFGLIF